MTAAWLALAVSVFASVLSAVVAVRTTRMKAELDERGKLFDRELRAEETLAKYREPLAAAAFDLQSRLFNILRKDFFGKWSESRGDDVESTTLFRFAQYFGWTEILRRDIQFLAFPEDENTRRVAELQFKIAGSFLTDENYGEPMMIWSDEQRAIGERMIVEEHGKVLCMGYARFRDERQQVYAGSLGRVREQVHGEDAHERLRAVQHLLCELVEALDANRVRYASNLERA